MNPLKQRPDLMTPNLTNFYLSQSKFTPCGSQTLSKMACRYPFNYPKFLVNGKKGKVQDEQGNVYVDLISGLGAISVGYCNPNVNDAVLQQISKGALFSLPNPLEYEVAKLLTTVVPSTEQWKFGKNGTDGTVMAVRAARAITGRDKILTVGYNGCADVFECQGTRTAGIPLSLKEYNYRAIYNNPLSFSKLNTKEYAAVLMEPTVFDNPVKGFLQEIKHLCTKNGTLLIFDEVVNGGRFENFVSSHYFKVKPDLYVLSKGIANGLPLCAVGGSRSIMSVFERNDFFASSTFGGECLSLAAARVVIPILKESINKRIQKGLEIKEAFNSLSWPDVCGAKGYPTRLNFVFPTSEHKFLFWQEMCKNKVLIGYSNFVMVDHTKKDIAYIKETIHKSFKVLKDNWSNPKSQLKGPIPTEVLPGRSN